jgi:hypothetical protein
MSDTVSERVGHHVHPFSHPFPKVSIVSSLPSQMNITFQLGRSIPLSPSNLLGGRCYFIADDNQLGFKKNGA